MEKANETLNFDVEILGDLLADGPKPIYDDEKKVLLGGFTIKSGAVVTASVPLKESPYTLHFTSGIPFYFTAMEGDDGKVAYALISEVPIRPYSVKVQTRPV